MESRTFKTSMSIRGKQAFGSHRYKRNKVCVYSERYRTVTLDEPNIV
jgi:hypothetical protein